MCFLSIFSSGGHFVQPSCTILAILVKGHKRLVKMGLIKMVEPNYFPITLQPVIIFRDQQLSCNTNQLLQGIDKNGRTELFSYYLATSNHNSRPAIILQHKSVTPNLNHKSNWSALGQFLLVSCANVKPWTILTFLYHPKTTTSNNT